MNGFIGTEQVETLIIGGGQAGLSVGYHLQRLGRSFAILDASERVGDAWRNRWDSLRLFTPARYDGLPGMPFPAPPWSFPAKDQVADYLEAYANRFDLPVRTGVNVTDLTREGDRYIATSRDRRFEASQVVVAQGACHTPRVPGFASQLDPSIVQLHSSQYSNPSQLVGDTVLVVGVGNSGAEIALELSRTHRTWLSGKEAGHIPVRHGSIPSRFVFRMVRFVGLHVLTVDTRIGRKIRPKHLAQAEPLIRVKPKDLARAGIERIPRVVGVRNGMPALEDDRALEVENVVWCTGFRQDFGWIDLPVVGLGEEPEQYRGVVGSEPGLYFVGLRFLYAKGSEFLPGVGRDAGYIVERVASRTATVRPTALAHEFAS
jgi:putative flavoprotein involved in K+ transport